MGNCFTYKLALDALCDWARANNLKLNKSKTKIMIFTRKCNNDRQEILLNNKVIEYIDTFKYLGVTFDNRLTWREHLKGQIKKAKASLVIGRIMGKHWRLEYWSKLLREGNQQSIDQQSSAYSM